MSKMLITVERIISNDNETLSTVFVNDKFVCFGLEDEFRLNKVIHETRIPAGEYDVTLRTVGGFNRRYTQKFPEFHCGMLWIRNVPNFEYVLIHIGNTDEDTSGCLLVGEGVNTNNGISVTRSTPAYKTLYQQVVDKASNNQLTIRFIDKDL